MARLEIGDVKGIRIWREGVRQKEGGEGVIWGSDSPEGEAYAEYQYRRLAGEQPERVDPGHALGIFFAGVKQRRIPKQVKLTVEGYRAALHECTCHPRIHPKSIPIAELMKEPPLREHEPEPEAPPSAPLARPGKNSPCPCGSGRRRKDCRGPRDEPHPQGWYVNHDQAPPVEAPPPPPPPVETAAAKRRRVKAERKTERDAFIDAILEKAHALDEARRARRRAVAKKTAAKKTTTKPPPKKTTPKKTAAKPAPKKKKTTRRATTTAPKKKTTKRRA